MITPIPYSQHVFTVDEQSALIDQTLPWEMIKFALSHLGFRDMISTIQVSRNWHVVTLSVAREQDSKHYQMVKMFGERMQALCPQISSITVRDFPSANNLRQCNQWLIERREEIVELLTSFLSVAELDNLEASALMIKKPKHFEILFEVAKKYQEFDKSVNDDLLIYISEQLCTVGSFEKAMKAEGRVVVSKSARLWYAIAQEHCTNKNPDKALDAAYFLPSRMAIDIVIKLFGMSAVDQGTTLANVFKLEQLFSALSLMKNGKLDNKALELCCQKLPADQYLKVIFESANNLKNEGNLIEALMQAKKIHNCYFRECLIEKLIEFNLWAEVPEQWLKWDVKIAAVTALCSYGKFVEARKICPDNHRSIIDIHEAVRDEKFDEVMFLAGNVLDECKLSISKKLVEKGQLEKAYQVACGIYRLKMMNEALIYINHHLEG